jgi:hypothetical protein
MSTVSDLASRAASKLSRVSGAGASAAQTGVEKVQDQAGDAATAVNSAVHDAAGSVNHAAEQISASAQHGALAVRTSSKRSRAAVGAAIIGLLALAEAARRRRSAR